MFEWFKPLLCLEGVIGMAITVILVWLVTRLGKWVERNS